MLQADLSVGVPLSKIAWKYGVSTRAIHHLKERYGLVNGKDVQPESPPTAQSDKRPDSRGGNMQARGRDIRERVTREVLEADIAAGLTNTQIAEKHGIVGSTLNRLLTEYGLLGRRRRLGQSVPQPNLELESPPVEHADLPPALVPQVAPTPAVHALLLTMRGEYPAGRVVAYLRAAAAMVEHAEPQETPVVVEIVVRKEAS
jgi:hypothetical protein